jgi:hypothetical protein
MNQIHILSFPNRCHLLHSIETKNNPLGSANCSVYVDRFESQFTCCLIILGLCEISNNDGELVAFPFNSKLRGGFVQLIVSKQEINRSNQLFEQQSIDYIEYIVRICVVTSHNL